MFYSYGDLLNYLSHFKRLWALWALLFLFHNRNASHLFLCESIVLLLTPLPDCPPLWREKHTTVASASTPEAPITHLRTSSTPTPQSQGHIPVGLWSSLIIAVFPLARGAHSAEQLTAHNSRYLAAPPVIWQHWRQSVRFPVPIRRSGSCRARCENTGRSN